MEPVIVIAAALMVIVLLEAGYRIALCLMRWAPSLVLGLLVGWIAHRYGVEALEAVGLGAFTMLINKRAPLPIFFYDQDHCT